MCSVPLTGLIPPDLAIAGLRALGDQPPDNVQPPLLDGTHLRWAFAHRPGRKLGFPWHGFFLFRREHREGERFCFSPDALAAAPDPMPGDPPEVKLHLPLNPAEPAVRAWVTIEPQQDLDDLVVTGFAGPVAVIQRHVRARMGEQTRVDLPTPGLTSIGLSVREYHLLEICYVPPRFVATGGWARLPDCPFPLGLPLTHPDYPATGNQAEDEAAAETMALNRVRYGPTNRWAGRPFSDLHNQLAGLVKGGPGVPMASDDRAVTLPLTNGAAGQVQANPVKVHPLELVLLGAINPAFAQMLGLYWVDRDADPGRKYDYLIVADYRGAFANALGQGIATALDQALGNLLPDVFSALLDAAQIDPGGPFSPPRWARAYRMPGGPARDANGAQIYSGQVAGLRWDLGLTLGGQVLAGSAAAYRVWRTDNLGDGLPAAAPAADDYTLLTPEPLLVTRPAASAGGPPQRPPDWPPFPLFYIDKALTAGWYCYGVTGIDIFGRHSRHDGPVEWRQWDPAPPGPSPLTYLLPPGETLIHPFAIEMQDVTPPPPPFGVEAAALDPDDPYVFKDAAYNAWRAANPALTGLRVSWLWGESQMLQGPDVAEFRVYYTAGTKLPLNADQSRNWDLRLAVVAYADAARVTVDVAGRPLRLYEMFLPAPASLAASPAVPVAYAHVTVTAADDAPKAADDPKWAGQPLGDRAGNEGRAATAAKVFVVNRVAPLPPVPPPDSEKVFATPADYHSRSFYTYRWVAQAGLRAHIFRAVDESVFEVDRNIARPLLDPADPKDRAQFPPEAVEPEWTLLRCQQAADAINALAALKGDREAALAAYRKLPNDALRVLAGLPGNERAFLQLTIQPLDPNAAENADRRGPDSPAGYAPQANLRAYVDTLDGRATNRYFYRAAYLDGANNRSPLSLSGPPIWLPNVVPPGAPVPTGVLGDERAIVLRWASNREADLAAYRVYRAEDARSAADLRRMALVETLPVPPGDPAARPGEVTYTDTDRPGLVQFYYRVVAVDDAGNVSAPSPVLAGRAFDEALPAAPPLALAWTADDPPVARAEWTAAEESRLERRSAVDVIWQAASGWLPAGPHSFDDAAATPDLPWFYRLRVRKSTGAQATGQPKGLPRP